MDEALLKSFVEKFNQDKSEFNKRFEEINRKLENMDKKFDSFDLCMEAVEAKCRGMENAIEQLGDFCAKMDDVNIYLSQIETRLNSYKTLTMSGSKIHDGELYILKIKLQKVKPIVNWENDELLSSKFKQIESKFEEIEESVIHNVI